MAATRTGGCTCGAVRYTLDPARAFAPYACHCRDCHTRSGGAVAVQVLTPPDGLNITGDLIEGGNTNPSGTQVRQYACAKCLTRIYAAADSRPELITLRGGTLDDSDTLIPLVHLWTQSKQAWVVIPDDAVSYPTQPQDPLEWIRLLVPKPVQ